MKKNIFSYFVWLSLVVGVMIFLFWAFELRPGSQAVPQEALQATPTGAPHNEAPPLMAPAEASPDSTEGANVASRSDRMVLNSVAHYRVAVPISWYVEKNGTTGIALYPDYDPQAGVQPSCKIEISALPNQSNLALADWLAAYLHQDPTADVAQASQSRWQISGRDAITWAGALNGVSTTLTYISGNALVYEIAPSGIKNSKAELATRDNDCGAELEIALKNLTIMTP